MTTSRAIAYTIGMILLAAVIVTGIQELFDLPVGWRWSK